MKALLHAVLIVLCCAAPARAETRVLPVPALTLYPGDAITTQQLVYKAFNGSGAMWPNYAPDIAALDGKFARRTLLAGVPIALSAIKTQDLVKRGIATRAAYHGDGLDITGLLMPLESGAEGDIIEARNMESGLTVHAKVMPDGSLQVGAP